jgi:hypothetical protein
VELTECRGVGVEPFMLDVDRLRDDYRKRAIRKLRRLRAAGKLNSVPSSSIFAATRMGSLRQELESSFWVAYIGPPPQETSKANEVVQTDLSLSD